MSIEQAERLKQELTDKYVLVARGVPELRRFAGLTGTVKTVNMNGKALVEFDGPVDISWYDIDPAYLEVVDAPLPKQAAQPAPAAAEATEKPKPAPKKPAGKSPLELARQEGAAGTAKPAAKPQAEKPAEAEGKKKLSPLELARQQGAAGTAKPAAKPQAEKPAAGEGKKLSPLELARQQGAAGGNQKSEAEAPVAVPPEAEEPSAAEEKKPPAEEKKKPPAGGKKLSPLELARQQGPAKQ